MEVMDHLHGVISRRELLAAGVGPGAIAHRLKTGRLFALYPGVYAVGRPDVGVWGHRRAVVLACGEGAGLGGRSAAAAWGMRPSSGVWEVMVPGPGRRRPAHDIRTRRVRLADDERTMLRGIPITTPMRTIADLAAVLSPQHLPRDRACHRARALPPAGAGVDHGTRPPPPRDAE